MDFMCKTIDVDELIKCTFGLTKTQMDIFRFLLNSRKCVDSRVLSEKLALDRTTIQKASKGLIEKKIVTRRQNNLDKGGYVFLYCVKDSVTLKEQMRNIINEWKNNADNQLNSIFG